MTNLDEKIKKAVAEMIENSSCSDDIGKNFIAALEKYGLDLDDISDLGYKYKKEQIEKAGFND